MTLQLQAQKRDEQKKLDTLRAEEMIPAVFYGAGKESTAIQLVYGDFVKVFREAGESTMIDLSVDGQTEQVLVQAIQKDPVSGKILHIDFKVIEAGKAIEVTVPLTFVGESPAVKNSLGSLNRVMHEVTLEVLPKDLPSEIEVDISSLETADDQILVKDLKVSAGTISEDEEAVVAVISAAREEKEEEASEEIDFSAIEVEKKGKAEEAPEDASKE
jgi:large subunit ribosomal protein L25